MSITAAGRLGPLLKYRGGKARELNQILPFVPGDYGRYVEPFLGGGALGFALQPERALLSDINAQLMGFYRGIAEDFERVQAEIHSLAESYESNSAAYYLQKSEARPTDLVTDPNEALYYRLRAQFNGQEPSTYHPATLYYFINKTAYSGMIRYNAAGAFNVPYGRYRHLGTRQVTPAHAAMLGRAELRAVTYQEIFSEVRGDDFVFLDPPYDTVFHDYGNGVQGQSFGAEAHEELAERLRRLPCRYLLVISRTELTERLYAGQIRASYPKSYAVNIRNRFKSAAEHLIVTNY